MTHVHAIKIQQPMSAVSLLKGKKDVNGFQRSVAICVGSVMTTMFLTPLEVIKTRVQIELSTKTCRKPKTSLQVTKNILSNEGFVGLYSGFSAFCWQLIPNNLIYFWTYESTRDYINQEFHGNELCAPIYGGILARIFATYAVAPFELVKTQLQSRTLPKGTSIFSGLKQNVQLGNFLSLWKGVGPTLWRDVPFSAIYWFFYEFFKKRSPYNLDNYQDSARQRFLTSFSSGVAAGTLAGFIVTPFDVVKTLRQSNLNGSSETEKHTFKVLKNVFKQGKLWGVFAGLGPRLIRVPPGCGIMISSYEMTKYVFEKKND